MPAVTFTGLMALASALTVGKLFVLAALVPAETFATYAATFAASMFVASLLSFGIVERTTKLYARLVAAGDDHQAVDDAKRTILTLAARTGVAVVLAGGTAMVVNADLAVPAMIATALSLVVNLGSLLGSVVRAHDRLDHLVAFSLSRAAIALAAASGAALLTSDWRVVLGVELLAMIAVLAWFGGSASRLSAKPGDTSTQARPERDGRRDGLFLFAAYLVASIPLTLDRSFVVAAEPEAISSTYAFLATWLAAAYTFTSILVQKFGPDVIRHELRGSDGLLYTSLIRHYAVAMPLLFFGVLLTAVPLELVFSDIYWTKYNLSFGLFVIVALAAALQITQLGDWVLIAFDRESAVLLSSSIFATTAIVGFLACAALSAGVVGYLTAVIIGRVLHLSAQAWLITREHRRRRAGDAKIG